MDRDSVIEVLDYTKRHGAENLTLRFYLAFESEVVIITDLTKVSPRLDYVMITTPEKQLYFIPYGAITAIVYT